MMRISTSDQIGFLSGKILIAMPHLADPRFDHVVIYVCGHDMHGAMGLIVNKLLPSVSFGDLMSQMNIDVSEKSSELPIHYGGPVEIGRGFVLHSTDYISDSTVMIDTDYAMTATLDVLRAMADDRGPYKSLLALGYVGWAAGQLEHEIHQNGWIILNADAQLIFSENLEQKWHAALRTLGVDPGTLLWEIGHA